MKDDHDQSKTPPSQSFIHSLFSLSLKVASWQRPPGIRASRATQSKARDQRRMTDHSPSSSRQFLSFCQTGNTKGVKSVIDSVSEETLCSFSDHVCRPLVSLSCSHRPYPHSLAPPRSHTRSFPFISFQTSINLAGIIIQRAFVLSLSRLATSFLISHTSLFDCLSRPRRPIGCLCPPPSSCRPSMPLFHPLFLTNTTKKKKKTPLMTACSREDVEIVKLILNRSESSVNLGVCLPPFPFSWIKKERTDHPTFPPCLVVSMSRCLVDLILNNRTSVITFPFPSLSKLFS